MTDRAMGFNGRPNTSRITQTGGIVYNANQDGPEYGRRGPLMIPVESAVKVYPMDLMFARTNVPAPRSKGTLESAIACWAGWDGARHEAASKFKFVGLARSTAQLQGMKGRELGRAFALWIGGSATIMCRSLLAIRQHARVMWIPPTSDKLTIDPSGHGRHLAGLQEFIPSECATEPLRMHEMINRKLNGFDMSKLSNEQKTEHGQAITFWNSILSIAFTAYITVEEEAGRSPDKLKAARLFGLNSIIDSGAEKEAAGKFQKKLLDRTFVAVYDKKKNISHQAEALKIFPGTATQTVKSKDAQLQRQVNWRQANQVSNITETLIIMYDQRVSRIIGWTPSGGKPGFDFDIIMNRL